MTAQSIQIDAKPTISQMIQKGITDRKIWISTLLIYPEQGAHANSLIYIPEHNTVFRFEPHGGNVSIYNNKVVNDNLTTYFKMWKLDYMDIGDVSPVGPQCYDVKTPRGPGGYCESWSILFTHLAVHTREHPRIIAKWLADRASTEGTYNAIRNYASFVVRVRDIVQEVTGQP